MEVEYVKGIVTCDALADKIIIFTTTRVNLVKAVKV